MNILSSNNFSDLSTNRPEQFDFRQGGEKQAAETYSTYMAAARDRICIRKPKCEEHIERGFTLVEMTIFVVIMGIIGITILASFNAVLLGVSVPRQQTIATQTANRCVE